LCEPLKLDTMPHCPTCGYSLRDLPGKTVTCPECGTEFSPSVLKALSEDDDAGNSMGRLLSAFCWCGLGFVLAVAGAFLLAFKPQAAWLILLGLVLMGVQGAAYGRRAAPRERKWRFLLGSLGLLLLVFAVVLGMLFLVPWLFAPYVSEIIPISPRLADYLLKIAIFLLACPACLVLLLKWIKAFTRFYHRL
jgi:hypothetical protein